MSEVNEESSTPKILDMLSVDCGWAADVLIERWAELRSEKQSLEQQLAERQWISVEDRLPQYWGSNIKFIVYIRGGEQQLSWYSSRGWDFYDVTHWMSLPEPPQE